MEFNNQSTLDISNVLIKEIGLHKSNLMDIMNTTFAYCNENGISESKSIEVFNYMMEYQHAYKNFRQMLDNNITN
jgi:hypothetical protein